MGIGARQARRPRTLIAGAAGLLAACGIPEGDLAPLERASSESGEATSAQPDRDASSGDDGAPASLCDQPGFEADATDWALPRYGPGRHGEAPFHTVGQWVQCDGGGLIKHELIALAGRGLELAVTSDCAPATGMGRTAWKLHLNTGTGFEVQPQQWSLPNNGSDAGALEDLVVAARDRRCPDGGAARFRLTALSQAHAPDLVVASNCGADAATGVTHWNVYGNTGTGFAKDPRMWALPDYGVDANSRPILDRFDGEAVCPAGGFLRHQLLDLDGDQRPDLVVSDHCADATGSTHWRVHANTGDGFAPESAEWELPDYGVDASGRAVFRTAAGETRCAGGGLLRHSLADLTGDGRPDLIVSDHCDHDLPTGATRWRVHANTGEGFAADFVSWALPTYRVDTIGTATLRTAAAEVRCNDGGWLRYRVVDVGGDARPELVVTDNCEADPQTGKTRWLVHANDGEGFAPRAVDWSLPDYRIDASDAGPFERLSDSLPCADGGRLSFATARLAGRECIDLIVTSNCAADTATGRDRWRLHRGSPP